MYIFKTCLESLRHLPSRKFDDKSPSDLQVQIDDTHVPYARSSCATMAAPPIAAKPNPPVYNDIITPAICNFYPAQRSLSVYTCKSKNH
jgi:hypothetical protein